MTQRRSREERGSNKKRKLWNKNYLNLKYLGVNKNINYKYKYSI